MDSDEIAAVLCRASDLRNKINHAIATAADRSGDEEADEDDKADSLLEFRYALESLEEQLASLQNLQQQQRYEREATLSEINHSRKFLLKKLKEYKGPELAVIHEASAFAGGPVENEDDLLLPPYIRRLPDSIMFYDKADNIMLGNAYSSQSWKRSFENGLNSLGSKNSSEEAEVPPKPVKNTVFEGIKHVLGFGVKAIFAIVSVISVVRMSGLEVSVRKGNQFNGLELFQKPANVEKREEIQCPPGKIPIVDDDGQQRCVVKERVEVPFEPVAATPDVNYGCG